jgi:branched-subunit amino acid ABC-type transport system permease component
VEQLLRDLITTLVTAGLYALMAAGLVLTYSTTRIFFLAFAGVAFSAAYIFFELNTGLGWPAWAAGLLVVIGLCPLLGLLLEVAVFRRLARASETAQIVANVGLLLALPALCVYVIDLGRGAFQWDIPQGATVLQVPGPGPQPVLTFHLFNGVSISSDEIIVLAVALVVLAALTLLLRVSTVGLRLRALADRRDLAAMRGISEPRMSRLAWVLGTVLAGVVGVVGAPLLHALNSDNYVFAVFIATCAAVIGGFRSVLWAAVGVVAISLISDLVFSYWTWASNVPGFNDSVPFVFLVVGLVVLGRYRGRVAGSISAEPPPPEYRRDLPAWRRLLPSGIGFGILVVFVFFVLGSYWVGQVTQGLIFSLIFLSITVITGIGGMVSLAQAAFVSGGGLVAGMLVVRYGLPWLPALLCAVAICVVLGVLVALPSLRLSGVALALSTLALGFICSNLVFQLSWLDNQNQGWTLTPPKIGPLDFSSTKTMAGLIFVLILVTVLMIRNIERSSTGRQMLAVRNAEAGAASIGISPVSTKLKLFALSAGIASLGGVLLATVQGGFGNTSVTTLSGLLWLAAVVLFGVRRPAAAVIAGLFIGVFPSLLSGGFTLPFGIASWSGTQATEIPTILFGLGAIFLARNPDGSLQGMARRNFERRDRRRRQRAKAAEFAVDPSGVLVAERVAS